MNILAVDDEELMRLNLKNEITKIFPEKEIYACGEASEAVKYLETLEKKGENLVYAFLDIELGSMTGIDLAKIIKVKFPNARILFVTGYSKYAMEAFQIHAMGYILKPVTADKLTEVLNVMCKEWKDEISREEKDIRIQTFGRFEVFVDGKIMSFEREKSKELLAYLIDCRGAAVTTAEIAGILWEDKPYDCSVRGQAAVIMSSLKRDLKRAGIEDIYVKTWNHLAIDCSKVRCDAFDFFKGNVLVINSYHGEYMENYSWAEFSKNRFEKIK